MERGIWYLYGPVFRDMVSQWVHFHHNFGIHMGPNFLLGRHTPTHFQRKTLPHPWGTKLDVVQKSGALLFFKVICQFQGNTAQKNGQF